MNPIYSHGHNGFFDRILIKKRKQMVNLIMRHMNHQSFDTALDIGTTNDLENESSNYLIKNLPNISSYKSISDQKIDGAFFSKILNRSILDDYSADDLGDYRSDLVISNATIEHVGKFEHQLKMVENVIKLTKRIFIISTPNRYHPLEFHTKLPLIHWLPKTIHRKILSLTGFSYSAKEENLNLLSKHDLQVMLDKFDSVTYQILKIRFFGFVSNYIVIGRVT